MLNNTFHTVMPIKMDTNEVSSEVVVMLPYDEDDVKEINTKIIEAVLCEDVDIVDKVPSEDYEVTSKVIRNIY